MTLRRKLLTNIAAYTLAAFTFVGLTYDSSRASTYLGQVGVGYSDNMFQISADTSSLVININAIGIPNFGQCASCTSGYTDNYTVNLFNQAGALLESVSEVNYLYYSMYSSSHGIGAGPAWLAVPAGATTLEVVSQLSIAGLLGSDGQPLSFGNLIISTDGSIAAATPIPATLPLLATGLAAFGLLGWHRRRKTSSVRFA
jgi:hypothetical protein